MGMVTGKIDWSAEAPNREKALFGAVLLVIIYAFATMIWAGQLKKTARSKSELANLVAQIKATNRLIDLASRSQPKVAQSEDLIYSNPHLATYIQEGEHSREEVLATAVRELSSPSGLHGLELIGLSLEKDIEEDKLLRIPMKIRLRGDFADTIKYMKTAETVKAPVLFDRLSIISRQEERQLLDITLEGEIFVLKDSTLLGGRN